MLYKSVTFWTKYFAGEILFFMAYLPLGLFAIKGILPPFADTVKPDDIV